MDGVNAGADGNVSLGALKTTGGTMTGDLVFSAGSIKRPSAAGVTYIFGGTNSSSGGYIAITGKDYGGTAAGGYVSFVAQNGSTGNTLSIKPDGGLTLNGKNIARSVNGLNADAAGEVTVNCISKPATLPSNSDLNNYGQTKMGYHVVPSDANANTITNRPCNNAFVLEVFGGGGTIVYQRATRYNDNAMWVRRLYNNTWSAWKNIFTFDGDTPSWGGKDITLGYPNYAAGVQTTFAALAGGTYTVPADGFVMIKGSNTDNGGMYVYVNGYLAYYTMVNSDNEPAMSLIPVKKGDVVKAAVIGAANTIGYFKFFPNR